MKAMILEATCNLRENREPLKLADLPVPVLQAGEVLVKVAACGVCHTELDEIEGRTPPPRFPVVLGHQVVGRVEEKGAGVHRLQVGDRVGVAWIYHACGRCAHCRGGDENLCGSFLATGRDADGGYAQYLKADESFTCEIPEAFSDSEAAPLLCAGAIGYRSLRLANIRDGHCVGLTGFGASAHLVLKLLRHQLPNSRVYVFARSDEERRFALELGAVWAGDTEEPSPEKLDSVIDTTPAWNPLVKALANLRPGGRLVVNAIRKEDADKGSLLELEYPRDLWLEKEVKSVANVTRRDVSEFLKLAAQIPVRPEVQEFPLEEANQALLELKERKIGGAKVLRIE